VLDDYMRLVDQGLYQGDKATALRDELKMVLGDQEVGGYFLWWGR